MADVGESFWFGFGMGRKFCSAMLEKTEKTIFSSKQRRRVQGAALGSLEQGTTSNPRKRVENFIMNKTVIALITAITMCVSGAALAGNEAGKQGNKNHAARAEKRFQNLDKNNDGKISAAELNQSLAARFVKMDTNKDGFLSKEDRKQIGKKGKKAGKKAGKRGAKMAKRMNRLDTNKDGKISAVEFQAVGPAMFKKLDKNGDGVITKDEMKQARKGHGKRPGKKNTKVG
jgi:Ca2+-binding EF-hand superfamily protein